MTLLVSWELKIDEMERRGNKETENSTSRRSKKKIKWSNSGGNSNVHVSNQKKKTGNYDPIGFSDLKCTMFMEQGVTCKHVLVVQYRALICIHSG